MVESFLEYGLGPHGRILADFYIQYQFPINSAVVGVTVFKLFFSRKKKNDALQPSTAANEGESMKV
ncbi:hypothetical protein BKP37_14200 [Anaerobacillus alkalilacustris]|uniref:Uncharacterized protein n=1 Tax=Anaerobacillus alkalilacustris TaxID=393763 RepID=A0A1S2LJU1_9BACI|nr:hypothetical protein [Anaerobacillus alkalilacustris]OIJ12574.1 hypothetical protein BKP37_14200 [Anaerobacillus alkalilacustris]